MIAWNGIGEPTRNHKRRVRVKLRRGDTLETRVGDVRWLHTPAGDHNFDSAYDIVAYEWADDIKKLSDAKPEDFRPGALFVVDASGSHFVDDRRGHGEVAGATGKDTNPKDLVGSRKAPLSTLPFRVLWRVGLAMLEGMCKYGRHNYRAVGVRASVYFDAVVSRHIGPWWEGEDIDADSGFHHLDKAIAALMVLRDSMLQGNWTDDRPPRAKEDLAHLNMEAARIVDQHADKRPHHFTIADKLEAS